MSRFDLPSRERIARGAAKCKAVQRALANPLPGCERYCTPESVKAERPVVVVYQFGYVICSAFDTELPVSELPGGGEFVEYRPLEEEDEWHPEKIVCVYRATLPRVNRAKGESRKPKRTRKPKPAVIPTPPVTIEADDADLVHELGIL